MRTRTRYYLLFFLLHFTSVLCLCQIKISKENDFDPSHYKTFAIEKGQVVCFIKDKKLDENRIFESFKAAVVQALTLRGYQLATDSTAQLSVIYVYEEKSGEDAQKPGPLGQTPVNDPATIDGSYRLSRTGEIRTLIIDIEKRNSSAWTATCSINGDQKDLDKAFNATIEAAFKKFPLQGRKKK